MTIWVILIYVLLFLYTILLFWLAIGFLKLPAFETKKKHEDQYLSIIICARNEEKNIALCIRSILMQEYDLKKIEMIVVNDASGDATSEIAESILSASSVHYSIVNNPVQKGKKESISEAILLSKHALILLRDADTFTRSKMWLRSISDFHSTHNADLIIGPIAFSNYGGLLWALQSVENNVLSILTAGSAYYQKAFLCSGANLIFTKKIFEQVGGFSSHLHIASGDDVLFLEEVKKLPASHIHYIKSTEALVLTYPCFSLGALIRQKIRWASKFNINPNPLNFGLSILTFLINLMWLICFIVFFSFKQLNTFYLIFILVKLAIDILLLFLSSRFIKNKWLLWYALPVALIYPLYIMIVSIGSLFFKPKWK